MSLVIYHQSPAKLSTLNTKRLSTYGTRESLYSLELPLLCPYGAEEETIQQSNIPIGVWPYLGYWIIGLFFIGLFYDPHATGCTSIVIGAQIR